MEQNLKIAIIRRSEILNRALSTRIWAKLWRNIDAAKWSLKKRLFNQRPSIGTSNELLKEVLHEPLGTAISKMTQSAAVAIRLKRTAACIRYGWRLPMKKENTNINLQLKKILHELSENALINKKRELKFNNRQENNQNPLLLVCDLSSKVTKADRFSFSSTNLTKPRISKNPTKQFGDNLVFKLHTLP